MDVANNGVSPALQFEVARLEIKRSLLEDLDCSGTIIHSGKRLSRRELGRVVLRGHHGLLLVIPVGNHGYGSFIESFFFSFGRVVPYLLCGSHDPHAAWAWIVTISSR